MVMLNNGGNYLKSDNCKKGDVIEFLDEGEWVASSKFKYDDGNPVQQFQVTVKLNGQDEHILSVNATNRNVLIPEWGKDTKLWIGKKATIDIIKVSVGGYLKNSILLEPKKPSGPQGNVAEVAYDSEGNVIQNSDEEVPF